MVALSLGMKSNIQLFDKVRKRFNFLNHFNHLFSSTTKQKKKKSEHWEHRHLNTGKTEWYFHPSARYNEFYFLTDPEDFIHSHWPDEEEWQLLDSPIKLEEFEKGVLKTSEFYKLGLTLIHPKQYLLITG